MPREWIDVEELRKKHWKKQESKQMTDITNITEPFGLLDKATQDELQAAAEVGADIETYRGEYGWKPKHFDSWYSSVVYRVKPEPVRLHRVHDLDRNGEFMGHHIITCNLDGTEPTVTWEPNKCGK